MMNNKLVGILALVKGIAGVAAILLLFDITMGFTYAPTGVVGDFSLSNTNGKKVALTDFPQAKGFIIVFTCNHCPFAKLYTKRLNNLHKKYSAEGVPLLAINSMDTAVFKDESLTKMKEKAITERFSFPYLSDQYQKVGRNFGALKTPHAFVIWRSGKDWVIKYNGAIDDNGSEPEKAIPYVENAVNEVLSGKKVSTPETKSVGCKISYRP